MTTANSEFAAAKAFLAPVFRQDSRLAAKGHGLSIIDRLACSNSETPELESGYDARSLVVRRALVLLLDIHEALCKTPDNEVRVLLLEPEHRQAVEGLLDLVSLEGIYPNLSPGVGIPINNRVKSVLQKGYIAKPSEVNDQRNNPNHALLDAIVSPLSIIAGSKEGGLRPTLEDRTFVDLIAALGELLYAPWSKAHSTHGAIWEALLAETSVSVLLRTFTSLLHPQTPEWLRTHVSGALSTLPMRPMGVAQTIIFIAGSAPQHGQIHPREDLASSRPSISLDVLIQISKLLSSVPSFASSEQYFKAIGPQLLSLLCSGEVDMRRAASLVIGTGILGRRMYGAPGTVGWKIFVEPLQQTIDTDSAGARVAEIADKSNSTASLPSVVSRDRLREAIFSLSALTTTHPVPGLTKRLIKPLLLPLWGLLCLERITDSDSDIAKECFEVISIYIKTSEGIKDLVRLVDNLTWEYHRTIGISGSSDLGLSPQRYTRLAGSDFLGDSDRLLHNLDIRVSAFLQLLKSTTPEQSDLGNLFIYIIQHWLQGDQTAGNEQPPTITPATHDSPIQQLCYAKLTQGMLDEYKDVLTKNPTRLLQLIEHILSNYVQKLDEMSSGQNQLNKPTLAKLASISSSNLEGYSPIIDENEIEAVSSSLSLVLTFLSTPEFVVPVERLGITTSLLNTLSRIDSSPAVDPSIQIVVKNALSLLATYTSPTTRDPLVTQPIDLHNMDRKKHSLALTYLSNDLTPVRAEGLALLNGLIKDSSPILDIPSICILLMSLLQDDEEFIYLSAIKALVQLASKHSKTVLRMLLEKYTDQSEETGLDQRLRVGEALLKTTESLGQALGEESARLLGERMIRTACRRAKRPKKLAEKQERIARTQEVDREISLDGSDTEEEADHVDHVQARLAKVLEGWEGKDGEEDIRIRTSALSILGAAIETNIAGLGATLTSTAVDLAISILKMETGPEKAILRRAAALVVASFLRVLGHAEGEGKQLGFGLAGQSLYDMIEVIEYIQAVETDQIVEGHLDTVLRDLHNLGISTQVIRAAQEQDFNALRPGRLAGLSVNPEPSLAPRPRIEEIE